MTESPKKIRVIFIYDRTPELVVPNRKKSNKINLDYMRQTVVCIQNMRMHKIMLLLTKLKRDCKIFKKRVYYSEKPFCTVQTALTPGTHT